MQTTNKIHEKLLHDKNEFVISLTYIIADRMGIDSIQESIINHIAYLLFAFTSYDNIYAKSYGAGPEYKFSELEFVLSNIHGPYGIDLFMIAFEMHLNNDYSLEGSGGGSILYMNIRLPDQEMVQFIEPLVDYVLYTINTSRLLTYEPDIRIAIRKITTIDFIERKSKLLGQPITKILEDDTIDFISVNELEDLLDILREMRSMFFVMLALDNTDCLII